MHLDGSWVFLASSVERLGQTHNRVQASRTCVVALIFAAKNYHQ